MIEDKRILNGNFKSVSCDIRKAAAFINLQARKNVKQSNKTSELEEDFEEAVSDEKFELA